MWAVAEEGVVILVYPLLKQFPVLSASIIEHTVNQTNITSQELQ